jgi:hypothetical protein
MGLSLIEKHDIYQCQIVSFFFINAVLHSIVLSANCWIARVRDDMYQQYIETLLKLFQASHVLGKPFLQRGNTIKLQILTQKCLLVQILG